MDLRNPTNVTTLLSALALFAILAALLIAIPIRRRLYRAGWRAPTSTRELLTIVCYALGTMLVCGLGTLGPALMVYNAVQSGEALNGNSGSHYVSVDTNATLFWNRITLDYLMGLVFLTAGIAVFPATLSGKRGFTLRVLARNLIPLIGILGFDWSPSTFLLLVVFQFALNFGLTIVSRAVASLLFDARRENRPISLTGIIVVVLFAAFLCAVPTALIGWPIVLGSPDVISRDWWIAVAAIAALAVANLIANARADVALGTAALGERVRRRFFLNLIGILPIAAMGVLIGDAHSISTMVTVFLYVGFAIVLDLELAVPVEIEVAH
jgi:hypothetical protein